MSAGELWRRCLWWLRRRQHTDELQEEMRLHLELRARALHEPDGNQRSAQQAAQRQFGNPLLLWEESQQAWGWQWLDTLMQDLRHALRQMRRHPGFTMTAVASLALGIGANSAVFSLMNAVILRPLPVPEPQQLFSLSTTLEKEGNRPEPITLAMFEEVRRHQQVFSQMAAWTDAGSRQYEANGTKYAAGLAEVDGNYFSTLGVQAVIGRLIGTEDVNIHGGSAPVAVLNYLCWQRRYHGDAAIIGKTIKVDGHPLTIIGVTPKRFTGIAIDYASDAIVPIGYANTKTFPGPRNLWLDVVGRKKPEVTPEQARAHLQTLWPSVQAASLPESYSADRREQFFARRLQVDPVGTGTSYLRSTTSSTLLLLMGLVGLVLLIACVNLATLMLARAAGQTQQTGIQIALGASGWRLLRQLLTESIFLSLAGGILGIAFASKASYLVIQTLWNGSVPMVLDTSPDGRILLFTLAISLLMGFLFGIAPARKLLGARNAVVQVNSRVAPGSVGRLGKLLVSAQVALCLVAVMGAALFVRSLHNLRSVDLGYRKDHILVVRAHQQRENQKLPDRIGYYRQLADRLGVLPGVKAVSYSHMGPGLSYEFREPVQLAGALGEPVQAVRDWVGPGFFRLMGMRVLAGREFTWQDNERAPLKAVISESLARQFFLNRSPIGHKLILNGRSGKVSAEIIGVVNSARLWTVQSPEPMAVYSPLLQSAPIDEPRISLLTAGEPTAVASEARQILESMTFHAPLGVQTIENILDVVIVNQRVTAWLAGSLGALALLLACVGLYGLVSYTVTQRTAEMGIRMALGARRRNIIFLILRDVVVLVVVGLVLGVPAVLAASRLVASLLFGIPANDPVTLALSAACLLMVALAAAYGPAWRASRIDPLRALRSE